MTIPAASSKTPPHAAIVDENDFTPLNVKKGRFPLLLLAYLYRSAGREHTSSGDDWCRCRDASAALQQATTPLLVAICAAYLLLLAPGLPACLALLSCVFPSSLSQPPTLPSPPLVRRRSSRIRCPSNCSLATSLMLLILVINIAAAEAGSSISIPAAADGLEVVADGVAICQVAKEWLDLSQDPNVGPYLTWRWQDVPKHRNYLAGIMHQWPEFKAACAACTRKGVPMPFLPDFYGMPVKTLDDLREVAKMILLHFPGHTKAKRHSEGFFAWNEMGYVTEPCINHPFYTLMKALFHFDLEVDVPSTLVWDIFPFVMHNDCGGIWILGEEYAEILEAMDKLYLRLFQYLDDIGSIEDVIILGKESNKHFFDRHQRRLSLAMNRRVCHEGACHPAHFLKGGRNEDSLRRYLLSVGRLHGDSKLASRIKKLDLDEMREIFAIQIVDVRGPLPTRKTTAIKSKKRSYWLITSPAITDLSVSVKTREDAAKVIGCSPDKLSLYVAGYRRKGVLLEDGETIDCGSNFANVKVCKVFELADQTHVDDGSGSSRNVKVMGVDEAKKEMMQCEQMLKKRSYWLITSPAITDLSVSVKTREDAAKVIGCSPDKLSLYVAGYRRKGVLLEDGETIDCGSNFANVKVCKVFELADQTHVDDGSGSSRNVKVMGVDEAKKEMMQYEQMLKKRSYWLITSPAITDLSIAVKTVKDAAKVIGCSPVKISQFVAGYRNAGVLLEDGETIDCGSNFANVKVCKVFELADQTHVDDGSGSSRNVKVMGVDEAKKEMMQYEQIRGWYARQTIESGTVPKVVVPSKVVMPAMKEREFVVPARKKRMVVVPASMKQKVEASTCKKQKVTAEKNQAVPAPISNAYCALPGCTRPRFAKGLCRWHSPRPASCRRPVYM